MHRLQAKRSVALGLAATGVLLVALGRSFEGAAPQASGGTGVEAVPVIPKRRAPKADATTAPPELPRIAAQVPPLTLTISIRREPAGGVPALTQTVSRTAEQVHLSATHGREWLFERNVRDARRASGMLIAHTSQAIVTYGESDLRMLMGIRGWADVLLLGFDLDVLRSYTPTSNVVPIGNVRFTRYAASRAAALPDLWWSDEYLLAREAISLDSPVNLQSSVITARAGVDRSLLERPETRFPTYRIVSVADLMEHHER